MAIDRRGYVDISLTPAEEQAIQQHLAEVIAEAQKGLKFTGQTCTHCGKIGASAQEEADHHTGECRCHFAKTRCWREWWGTCQPKT